MAIRCWHRIRHVYKLLKFRFGESWRLADLADDITTLFDLKKIVSLPATVVKKIRQS